MQALNPLAIELNEQLQKTAPVGFRTPLRIRKTDLSTERHLKPNSRGEHKSLPVSMPRARLR